MVDIGTGDEVAVVVKKIRRVRGNLPNGIVDLISRRHAEIHILKVRLGAQNSFVINK